MRAIMCEYYNHQGDRMVAITDEHQEELCLVNIDKGTNCIPTEVWALDSMLDDINWNEPISIKVWAYDGLVNYIKNNDDAVIIESFKRADIMLFY